MLNLLSVNHITFERPVSRHKKRPSRMNLSIQDVRAYPAYIPVKLSIGAVEAETALSCVVVEVETVDGLTGHGFTAITDEEVILSIIRDLVAPNLRGKKRPAARTPLRAALLDADATRPDGLCQPRHLGRRPRALGHSGQGIRSALLEAARRGA